jgi:hypothetical protein
MTNRYQSALPSGPIRIISQDRPQFAIINGPASFTISLDQQSQTTIGGSITVPTAHIGAAHIGTATISSASIENLRLTGTAATYTGITTGISLDPQSLLKSIIAITDSPSAADPYNITLPSGTALATTSASQQPLLAGQTITFSIINNTASVANLLLAAPATDVIMPLGSYGFVVIEPYSNTTIIARMVSTTPPIAEYSRPSIPSALISATTASSFPPAGSLSALYCDTSTGALYRWGLGSTVVADWTVGKQTDDDFPTLAAALASPSVLAGHKIHVRNGTYTMTSTLIINKGVQIFGESRAGTVLRSQGTASDPVALISIQAPGVAICNLTIAHLKTSNTSIDTAINIPTAVAGFILDGCICYYEEFCVTLRSSNWKINGCTFIYAGAPTSVSYRTIGIYGTDANGFVTSNVFDNSSLVSGTSRAILETSGNATGTLVVANNTQVGRLVQVFIMESFVGIPCGFAIYVKDNVFSEVLTLFAFYNGTPGFADTLCSFVAEGNTVSNAHGTGMFAIDGGSGVPIAARTMGPIPIHARDNVVASSVIHPGWLAAIGSSDSMCNYNAATISPVTVVQDTAIPPAPIPSATPTDLVFAFRYVLIAQPRAMKANLVITDATGFAGLRLVPPVSDPRSLLVCKNHAVLYEEEDYTMATADGITLVSLVAGPAPSDVYLVQYQFAQQ